MLVWREKKKSWEEGGRKKRAPLRRLSPGGSFTFTTGSLWRVSRAVRAVLMVVVVVVVVVVIFVTVVSMTLGEEIRGYTD